MKNKKFLLLIGLSSIALIVVLIIQVNWILETARIKEEMFNEKANMVLARTTEALCDDKETCMRIGSCIEMDENESLKANLSEPDINKIDSLFNYYMKYYNLHVDYTYVFEKDHENKEHSNKALMSNVFYKPMEEVTHINGLELKLVLPDKKQYILAEMGSMFLTSVLLILIVIIIFWRTILSLLKEKQIADHTVDFLNNMTHEFKTPLTNIALAGKMVMKESAQISNENKLKNYSEIILAENDKLRSQVEQVLEMTALERNDLVMSKAAFSVHDIVNEVLKCMSLQFEQKNVKLVLELNAEHDKMNIDKNHFTNVICNLIDNALKYSKESLELKIETENQSGNFILKISDNGIGMEKDQAKLIFNKYFRITNGNIHNVKGFGLGLAYVKKIIDLHKGQVMVKSELGKGSQFIITLPND